VVALAAGPGIVPAVGVAERALVTDGDVAVGSTGPRDPAGPARGCGRPRRRCFFARCIKDPDHEDRWLLSATARSLTEMR
jgi:hypothetical protein